MNSVMMEESWSERAKRFKRMLEFMKPWLDAASTRPVLLSGDFNAVFHLDWIADTASSHGNIGHVEWPTSVQVIGAGMVHSFCAVHPVPVKEPGFTWFAIPKAGGGVVPVGLQSSPGSPTGEGGLPRPYMHYTGSGDSPVVGRL